MLSNEVMGLLALGVSWMTGLMIVLDALIDARNLRAKVKAGVLEGVVKTDELAVHELEQRVKELDSDAPGLVFFDRHHRSTVKGGTVEIGGQAVTVKGAPQCEVWFDAATREAAAACTSTTQFDSMKQRAQGAGGGLRTIRTALQAGQKVWLVGTRDGDVFTADVVSAFDPRTFVRARQLAVFGTCLVSTLWVAAGTVLAFWPPVFGLISIGGAVVLIAHFLGMTPLAIASREKSRTPAVAFVRGIWKRDEVKQEAGVAGPVVAER